MIEKLYNDDDPKQFEVMSEDRREALTAWIADNLSPRVTINKKHSSYGLKQKIDFGSYTNGEFKGAMLASGYSYHEDGRFWYFNVSERSVTLKASRSQR